MAKKPEVIQSGKPLPHRHSITAQTVDARDMLANGLRYTQVVENLAAKYGIAERTARRRIKDARDATLADVQSISRPELAAALMETYLQLLQESKQCRQYNAALGCANAIAKLAGLIDQPK